MICVTSVVSAAKQAALGLPTTVAGQIAQRRHLGGVWDPDVSYPDVGTQTNGRQYSFSEFPMPDSYPEWPNGAQVYAYLTEYAKRFEVFEHIVFGMAVEELSFDDRADQWTVRVSDGSKTTQAVSAILSE